LTKDSIHRERELAAAIEKTRALAGTVIVQNPNDGAISGAGDWPKFQSNTPNAVKTEERMDRAVSAIYEPGSTFKIDHASRGVRSRPDQA